MDVHSKYVHRNQTINQYLYFLPFIALDSNKEVVDLIPSICYCVKVLGKLQFALLLATQQ